MQNRNMFPFRRQGQKKRNKNNNARRPRGPQKPLPNSARDLLPVLQPTTKALAQVLAGRSNASGQLAHAQAVLAHAERLIGERAHNRLNPGEREEFFEQLARLRLTLSDAEAEAQVVAAEEQEPRPVAPPVDQARLRALALALSTPGAAPVGHSAQPEVDEAVAETVDDEAPRADDATSGEAEAPPAASSARVSAANARSGRLQLSRGGSDDDPLPMPPPAASRVRRTRQRLKPVREPAEPTVAVNGHDNDGEQPVPAGPPAVETAPEVNEAGEIEQKKPAPAKRTRRRKTAGVPEGWVIDEEGFVVPGP